LWLGIFGDELDEARHEKGATLIGYFAHAMVGGSVLLLTILRSTFRSVDGTPRSGSVADGHGGPRCSSRPLYAADCVADNGNDNHHDE